MADDADDYSAAADAQLDELEESPDVDGYNAVLEICELVLSHPARAQANSSAITTAEHGIVMRLPVPGTDLMVFWTTDGPRIEAVLPHPYR